MSGIDFELLVKENKSIVFNTCLMILNHYEEAEDLAQDVFIDIYKNLNQFRNEANIQTWIYRITVNSCFEHLRKQKTQKRKGKVVPLENLGVKDYYFEHPGILLEKKEKAKILFYALDKIPEEQKMAFILSKSEGLSLEEIAKILNKSISAVKSLIFRAKDNLRNIIIKIQENEKSA